MRKKHASTQQHSVHFFSRAALGMRHEARGMRHAKDQAGGGEVADGRSMAYRAPQREVCIETNDNFSESG